MNPPSGVLRTEWLGTFLAIAEQSGVRAASHVLHLSQSRVSAHLSSLERVVGVRLVDRGPRGTRLTAQGEVFRAHVRRAFAELDLGLSVAHDSALESRARIGLCTPVPPSLLSALVWPANGPLPPPSFIELSAGQVSSALRDESIDVAVVATHALDAHVPQTPLHRETVLRVGEPASDGRVFVRAEDAALFRASGIVLPPEVHPVVDLTLALALVHAGHGTAVAMRSTIPMSAPVTTTTDYGSVDFSLTWSDPPSWLADLEWRAHGPSVPNYGTPGSLFPRSTERSRA